jgi:hypothetical protein
LFLDRSGTKEEKSRILKQISDRQQMSESGLVPPLMIYPEGCSSNGDYLLEFKKGAFAGLNSIQPNALKWSSPFCNPSHTIMD